MHVLVLWKRSKEWKITYKTWAQNQHNLWRGHPSRITCRVQSSPGKLPSPSHNFSPTPSACPQCFRHSLWLPAAVGTTSGCGSPSLQSVESPVEVASGTIILITVVQCPSPIFRWQTVEYPHTFFQQKIMCEKYLTSTLQKIMGMLSR